MTVPDERTDHTSIERRGLKRRPLLKILGVSTALSLGSGVATARDVENGDDVDEGAGNAEIDPYYGFSTPDADNIPSELEPDHEVELHVADPVPEEHGPLFHFDPTGLAVEVDDVVGFTFTTPDHTVTAYHPGHGFQQRVPNGVPPFSSPVVNAGGSWLYQFEEEGLYDLYCAPHHVLGMTMRIVVGQLDEEDEPAYEDTFTGSEDPPLLPPFTEGMLEEELDVFSEPDKNVRPEWVWLTPTEVLDAETLDPGRIQEEGAVSFDDVLDEISRVETDHDHE